MCFEHNPGNYRPLPILSNHKCFGCSPVNASGLQMKFFTNDKSLFSRVTVPNHLCGWDRLVHGGVISTMLDEIMSWSAIFMLKRIILTKSITVDFIKPVFIDNELTIEGKVLKEKSEREVIMEGFLYNRKGELCSRSKGTFALFTPGAAIKMGILNEENVKDFEQLFNAVQRGV
jgi:acyl-coenzyme A thioesterase PaaI-like protein